MKKLFIILCLILVVHAGKSQVLISLVFGDKLNSDKIEFGLDGGLTMSDIQGLDQSRVLNGFNLGFYFDSNLTDGEKEQLRQALSNVISNRFPGMNYVLDGKELDGNGKLNVTSLGFRYIIHIGFSF